MLAALNPDITLPNVSIAPVHRYDASGTSFVFTSYLAAVSPAWLAQTGAGTAVTWPVGSGARGNDGVASTVSITRGGIGYVESSFATENHLNIARLRNRSGAFVKPTADSFAAAAAAADWNVPGFAASLVKHRRRGQLADLRHHLHPAADGPERPARAAAVLKFFDWAYTNGTKSAEQLGYLGLPAAVQDSVRALWRTGFVSQ